MLASAWHIRATTVICIGLSLPCWGEMDRLEPDPGIRWVGHDLKSRLAESFRSRKGCSSLARTSYSRPSTKTSVWNKLSMHRTTCSSFNFIFQPVEDDFDRHQGERDPADDSRAGGDQVGRHTATVLFVVWTLVR